MATPLDSDDELPPWLGERFRDDLHRVFRRETGPDSEPHQEHPHD